MTIFILLIPILLIWLILSVFAQFSKSKYILQIKLHDHFALLPLWTFFAPNPGVTDYRLLYRDTFFDGQITPWKEVELSGTSPVNAIWNPEKRSRKTIVDSCQILFQILSNTNANSALVSNSVLVSMPYLTILCYVMNMPRNNLCEYRQFLICSTYGFYTSKEPDILFISQTHRM
jgi:hypothetical protein